MTLSTIKLKLNFELKSKKQTPKLGSHYIYLTTTTTKIKQTNKQKSKYIFIKKKEIDITCRDF